jgi:hypothetical protein
MNKQHISFYDLDGTLWNNPNEIWIIDKEHPAKPVLVLDPIEFALIKRGHYRKDEIVLDYNGQCFYISEELSKKIQKRAHTENMERFGISLMPLVSRELLNKSQIEFLTNNIKHLRFDKFVDIGILTARSNQGTSSDQLNELRLELGKMGINIHKIFFVGKSVNTGQNYVNKMNILLEHLIGFKIRKGKFVSLKQDWYKKVSFYDDDPQNIHYANDIQRFFDEIIRKTDDEVFHMIIERIKSNNLQLDNYLVTTNDTNRFVKSTVILKEPTRFPIRESRIMTFEKFNESKIYENVNSNLIEYTTRELFKKKMSADKIFTKVAKKFNGHENMFLGGIVEVTPTELKDAVYKDKAETFIRQYKNKPEKIEAGLIFFADYFNLDPDTLKDYVNNLKNNENENEKF